MPSYAPRPRLAALVALALPFALALPWGLSPRLAEACGGTFCDGAPPVPMPVDQTGEDILFIRDGDQMEVHVRIEYSGAAERFAWMVPLPAIPTVSVGSEPLFAEIAAATIPVWTTTRSFEDPNDAPSPPPSGFTPSEPEEPGEPEVVLEESVGAFEVVVLQGGTAASVLEFFDSNDYSYEPNAAPIIQQYLDEGFLITGVKLSAGVAVEAIHPLVFRFVGDEPCVPIRLTAVAAKEDMGIRAYFLGQERWAPSNYAHVELNAAAYNWSSTSTDRYAHVLSLAVDEAGGRAFATDYAGPSEVVARATIWQPNWMVDWTGLSALEAMAALDSLGMLAANGLPSQLRVILREYVPVPEGWNQSEDGFWSGYWAHPELIDTPAWSGAAFAADFEERVVEPGAHAVDMLEAWPYLTRLHTTISPHEMTVDPMFHPNSDLPEVVRARTTRAFVYKDFEWASYRIPLELDPDGMTAESALVCVADDGGWPLFEELPRALRIEQIPAMGPPQVVTDNVALIRSMLDTHNQGSPCAPEPGGETGDDDGAGGTEGGETGGPAVEGGKAGGCSVEPIGGAGSLGFGLGLVLLGIARRRRR